MADTSDKEATTKEASGILIYLVEELGDARLRASQLKQYVASAIELVNESEKKDHIYEVAADLLQGIPDTLFKLDKALDAAAMAASRMDYEEIKQGLKPEKADELERVLEDVRLQYLKRRSDPMSDKKAVEVMEAMAEAIEATGEVPKEELASLIAEFEEGQKQASRKDPAEFFHEAAEYVRSNARPDFRNLAASMRRILADNLEVESARKPIDVPERHQLKILLNTVRNPMNYLLGGPNAEEAEEILREKFQYTDAEIKRLKMASDEVEAGAGEEFKKVNPKITDKEVEEINEMHEKHKDVVKEKHASLQDLYQWFDDAFMSARLARQAAQNGQERRASLAALDAIYFMCLAASHLSPKNTMRLTMMADKIEVMRNSVASDAARSSVLVAGRKTAAQGGVLADFEAAFTAAKMSRANAERGNERKAAFFGLHAVDAMARALAALAPKYADKLLMFSDKAQMLRAGVVSDAAQTGALSNPAPVSEEVDFDDFNAPWSKHHYASNKMNGRLARFEEGVPADPTENMTEEDAAEWEAMNEQHRDKFKSAREDNILHETKNLYLYKTPKGLEIRLTGPNHAVVVGNPKDVDSAKRTMERLERYPDKLREMYKSAASDEYGLTAASGLPRFFNLTDNPIPQLGRVKGFDSVSDDKLMTKDRRFSLVPTSTLSSGAMSHILDIGPNDTVALLDVHGEALSCASPKDIKFNLKNMDRWPWTEVRASAAGTWDPSVKYSATMGRSARLMARQEAILKKYVEAGGNSMSFDELPVTVQTALQRVKDQETLWSDVDRWLSDNNNPHLKRGLFASDDDNQEEQQTQQKQAGRYGQYTRRRIG